MMKTFIVLAVSIVCANAFPYKHVEATFEDLSFDPKGKDFDIYDPKYAVDPMFTAPAETTTGWDYGHFDTTMEDEATTATDSYTTESEETTATEEYTTWSPGETTATDVYTTWAPEETTATEAYTTGSPEETTATEEYTTGNPEETTTQEEFTTATEEYTTFGTDVTTSYDVSTYTGAEDTSTNFDLYSFETTAAVEDY